MTPIILLFFSNNSTTSLLFFTITLFSLSSSIRAFNTSIDLSDIGKILFPLSVFTFTPCFSNMFIMSLFVKLENALYKNLPLPGIFFMNSEMSKLLVILHLPFPVIRSFLP